MLVEVPEIDPAMAEAEGMGFFEVLSRLNPAVIGELLFVTFSPIDLLFYGIAVYGGYRLSFRQIDVEELDSAIKGAGGNLHSP